VTRRLDPARHTIVTTPQLMQKRGDSMRGLLEAPVQVEELLAGLSERLAAPVSE
jgi:hypothetical protein